MIHKGKTDLPESRADTTTFLTILENSTKGRHDPHFDKLQLTLLSCPGEARGFHAT
jgi:hypothetical protein